MKVLAIETASKLGGLAVLDQHEGLIAESKLNVLASHSETLMVEIDHVLRSAGVSPRELDVIAVSSGPGAFTGLRVGLGTAKGLAYASGAGIVAVPTLQAYALSLPYTRCPVAPMLDARRREVYAGLYLVDENSSVRQLVEEQPIKATDFIDLINEHECIVFAGQGALVYREDILKCFKGKALYAPPTHMHPSPASVATLGLKMALADDFSDPKALSPMYLRKSEAESVQDRNK